MFRDALGKIREKAERAIEKWRIEEMQKAAVEKTTYTMIPLYGKGKYIEEHAKPVIEKISHIHDVEHLNNLMKNIDTFKRHIEQALELLNAENIDESKRKHLEEELVKLMVFGAMADSKAHLKLAKKALEFKDKLPAGALAEIMLIANAPFDRIMKREKWPYIEYQLTVAPAGQTDINSSTDLPEKQSS